MATEMLDPNTQGPNGDEEEKARKRHEIYMRLVGTDSYTERQKSYSNVRSSFAGGTVAPERPRTQTPQPTQTAPQPTQVPYEAPQQAPVFEQPPVPPQPVPPAMGAQSFQAAPEWDYYQRIMQEDAARTKVQAQERYGEPAPQTAPVKEASEVAEESDTILSSSLRIVIATFATFVIALLAVIGICTSAIGRVNEDIAMQRQEQSRLNEQLTSITREIEDATSLERGVEYAEMNGMILG